MILSNRSNLYLLSLVSFFCPLKFEITVERKGALCPQRILIIF